MIFLGILNFDAFDYSENHFSRHWIVDKNTFRHELKDLEWNFVELKKFKKSEAELETTADKWIYFIQQAIDLDHIPENANTDALKLAYEIAEQHQWTAEELAVYDAQEMEIHRRQNVLETAKMEARLEGRLEGELEEKQIIAKGMLEEGLSFEIIKKLTGLTQSDIENLQKI